MATYALIKNIQGGAKENVAIRVKSSQFGDGYEQASRDGLNPFSRSWDVTFMAELGTPTIAFKTALEAAMGDGIVTWQSPLESSPSNWRIRSYSTVAQEGQVYEVSATLVRRYP